MEMELGRVLHCHETIGPATIVITQGVIWNYSSERRLCNLKYGG
jgi:hypothetical protein